MTATTYGGRPPCDPVALAHRIEALLELERVFGTVPEHVVLRVLVLDHARIAVTVAGLSDLYLVGPARATDPGPSDPLEPADLTLPAAALHRTIRHIAQSEMPTHPDGELQYPLAVLLQSEGLAARTAHLPTGVVVLVDGRPV